MTVWGTQTMETHALIKQAQPIPCFVCQGSNTSRTELCLQCGAPLALAFPDARQQKRRQLVAVLGPSGAGKTVYLGLLTDILSRRNGTLQILARGAYSVALQQHTLAALAGRSFPAETPNSPSAWNWLHCEISGLNRHRHIDLIMPDLAGAAIYDGLHTGETPAFVRPFLTQAAAAILLVDVERVERGGSEQDFQAMRMVSYLGDLIENRKRGWRRRPVAIVFAKADSSEPCRNDPTGYAAQRLPGLYRLCRERLQQHAFFAASVVGSSAETYWEGRRVSIPLRVEPRGIVAPFEWLVRRLK